MIADPFKLRIAALLGFLGVSLGAFAAHGLEPRWLAELTAEEASKRIATWDTATFYHMVHAVVLLFLAYVFPKENEGKWIWSSFTLGVLIFSGSLYALCYWGIKWLGAITPIGGLLMILGWLLLAVHSGKKQMGQAVRGMAKSAIEDAGVTANDA